MLTSACACGLAWAGAARDRVGSPESRHTVLISPDANDSVPDCVTFALGLTLTYRAANQVEAMAGMLPPDCREDAADAALILVRCRGHALLPGVGHTGGDSSGNQTGDRRPLSADRGSQEATRSTGRRRMHLRTANVAGKAGTNRSRTGNDWTTSDGLPA